MNTHTAEHLQRMMDIQTTRLDMLYEQRAVRNKKLLDELSLRHYIVVCDLVGIETQIQNASHQRLAYGIQLDNHRIKEALKPWWKKIFRK